MVQSNRAEQTWVESGLAEKLAALTQQIDELTVERQPCQFADMDALAQTLSQRQTEEQLGESLEQLQQILDHVEPSINVQTEIAQLAQVLQSVHDQQRFIESGLDVQLSKLSEKLQVLEAQLQPQYRFTGMAELASTLSSQRVQAEIASNLQHISQSLSQLDQGIEQAINQQRVDAIASGIEQWRSEQAITEAILNHQYEGIPELAEVVQSVTEHQVFVNSGLDAQMSELAEKLQAFAEQPTPYHFNGVVELAEVIHQRRAEDAIAAHLANFEQAAERLTRSVETLPALQHITEVVRSLRENESLTDTPVGEPLQQLAAQLRAANLNPTPPPKLLEPFWVPEYPAGPPDHIEPEHWEEFKRSAIHPDLIALNAESVSGQEVFDRLLSDRMASMGSGQYVTAPMARLMAQYEQVAEGGWWGQAGIDARSLINLQPGEQPTLSTWGCFKPDHPRVDQDKSDRKGEIEYKKYENPLGVSRSLYLPIVPDNLAERIYKKHDIQPTEAEKQSGFWYIVRQYNLPITPAEGVKKTWASLSQGEVTIGVSGVNGLYRAKDQEGNLLPERQLNEEMAVFATPGREFRFAYDQDTKASTIRNVRRDLVRSVELLEDRGCICKVARWQPDQGKGLDDLIVNQGPRTYTAAIAQAHPTDREKQIHYRTEYNAIARQVKAELPKIAPGNVDAHVYLRSIAKGELRDGDRILSQSDQARSLKDPEQVAVYIEQVKTSAPHLRQQQRELEAAQVKADDRVAPEQGIYRAIAQGIREVNSTFPIEIVDRLVCIAAQDFGADPDRLLTHSDQVRSHPDQAQAYIEGIKRDAAQYRHNQTPQPPEIAPEATPPQSIQDSAIQEAPQPTPIAAKTRQQRVAEGLAQIKQELRAEYDLIAEEVKQELGDVPPEVLDLEVYLREGGSERAKRLLQVGDAMNSLRDDNSDLYNSYLGAIARVAPAYEGIKNDPDAELNYKQMAGIVNMTSAIIMQENTPEPTIYRKKQQEDELIL